MHAPYLTVFMGGVNRTDVTIRGVQHTYKDRPPIVTLELRGVGLDASLHLDDVQHMIALGEKIVAEGHRLLVEAEQIPVEAVDALTAEDVEEARR